MRISSNTPPARTPNYPRFGKRTIAPRDLPPGVKRGRPATVAEVKKRQAFVKTMQDIRSRLMKSLFGDTSTREAIAADKTIDQVFSRIKPGNVETRQMGTSPSTPRSRLLGKA